MERSLLKYIKIFILLTIIMVCLVFYFTIFNRTGNNVQYDIVRIGISKNTASKIMKNNEKYFIIQPELWTTSKGWKIISNKEIFGKIDDIEVKNKEIEKDLPSMVLLNENNKFLVKATFDKKNKVLEVEDWEFITPITRDYERKNRNAKTRKSYPKDYVDQFDLDNGDYKLD